MALYSLELGGETPQLLHVANFQGFSDSTLVLSIAVDEKSRGAIATLSTGEAAIVQLEPARWTTQQKWKAHDLEVWCGAWKSPNEVLTGGDDALLKLWDIRDSDNHCSIQSRWYI
jgi:WD40 repeat protein